MKWVVILTGSWRPTNKQELQASLIQVLLLCVCSRLRRESPKSMTVRRRWSPWRWFGASKLQEQQSQHVLTWLRHCRLKLCVMGVGSPPSFLLKSRHHFLPHVVPSSVWEALQWPKAATQQMLIGAHNPMLVISPSDAKINRMWQRAVQHVDGKSCPVTLKQYWVRNWDKSKQREPKRPEVERQEETKMRAWQHMADQKVSDAACYFRPNQKEVCNQKELIGKTLVLEPRILIVFGNCQLYTFGITTKHVCNCTSAASKNIHWIWH